MNYFDKVYQTQPNTIEIDSPVFIHEVAILKDTVDNQVLLRNTFANISNQIIVALRIEITLQDIFGETVLYEGKESFEYIYQDVIFEPDTLFGNKIAIQLPDEARKAFVKISKVVLQDGTVWKSDSENIVTLQPQREIEASDEFIYSLDDNSVSPIFYYVENDSCWQCTCGQANRIDQNTCTNCERDRLTVSTVYNPDNIKDAFKRYRLLKAEEKKRQRELQKKEAEQFEKAFEPVNNDVVQNVNTTSVKKRFPLIPVCAVILGILIFTALFYIPKGNNNSNSERQTANIDCITKDGSFLPSNKIYDVLEAAINGNADNKYMLKENQEGGLGFYHNGDENFTYIVFCMNGKDETIPFDEKIVPCSVVFYRMGTTIPDNNEIALFIETCCKDMSFTDAYDALKTWEEKRSFTLDHECVPIVIGGNIFLLWAKGRDDQYIVSLEDYNINYKVSGDPKRMLTNIYCYDDKAKAAIEDLSYDDAKILLDYYSEHEKEVFPYDKLLSSTELGTTEARSVTTDSTKESGKGKKSTKNTESSHTCLECGESATHSIMGLNDILEWYCDKHWKEMQDNYDKITGADSHTCLECGKSANHSITGLNGTLEWYCDQHWQEMQEMYNKITNPN